MKSFLTSLLLLSCAALGADTNALPPLAPPYGKIPPTLLQESAAVLREHPVATFAGVLILLPLAAFALWQIFKPRPQPLLSPETIARTALLKLLRQAEDGKCLSDISQILRRYIVAAFNLPPAEMTTAEFCTALARSERTDPELAQAISGFLRECDERKFSSTPSSDPLNAANHALDLVNEAENLRARSAPVSDAATRVTTPGTTEESSRHKTTGVAASGDGRTP